MENFFKIFSSGRKHLYWKGYCHGERHASIYDIENVINKNGYIDDFHMFSDMAISLKINLEERHVAALHKDLADIVQMTELNPEELQSSNECTVYLNLTFSHATGNLKIEVPAVPG